MNDKEVADLLRSDSSIVVIEAPAGCGKTHQAAGYAADIALNLKRGRLLVLTHTHAACSIVAERTQECRNKIEIRTLDGLISQVASAYHLTLDLPRDVSAWARKNGYELLAEKAAGLLRSNPMIAKHLTRLYPVVICDEHQDSNEAQDELVQLLAKYGSQLRVFGDPMQIIPGGKGQNGIAAAALARWNTLKAQAAFGQLETPHRWKETNPELGSWILRVRATLMSGSPIDFREPLPAGVQVKFAENAATIPGSYRLAPEDWDDLNALLNEDKHMLLLGGTNATIKSLRGTFRPRFPIWEGHTRSHLEAFIESFSGDMSGFDTQILAFVDCLKNLLVGFCDSKYCNRLIQEISEPTTNPRGKIPPHLKVMAELIRAQPSHLGFSRAAEYLKTLIIKNTEGFSDLHIDYAKELDDLIKLKRYNDPAAGFAEISQRRSRAHPKPPRKSLSTVHKSKGLEAESVIVFGCDREHFPGTQVKRNLLYVALSRTTTSVTVILSRNSRSPLVEF